MDSANSFLLLLLLCLSAHMLAWLLSANTTGLPQREEHQPHLHKSCVSSPVSAHVS